LYLDNFEEEIDCLSDYKDRTIATVRCNNPSHCEFMQQCLNNSTLCNTDKQNYYFSAERNRCWDQRYKEGRDCVRVPYSHLNGIVECQVRGLRRQWLFFHSLESTKCIHLSNTMLTISKCSLMNNFLVTSYLEASPSELIQMDDIPTIIYTNLTITFVCKAAYFIFADSITFQMLLRNGSSIVLGISKLVTNKSIWFTKTPLIPLL